MSAANLEAENFISSGLSPKKRQIDQKIEQTLFTGQMHFDFEGNSIFGKQAMTVGKSGFGDNLLSDYHWDNNPQFPSLLSRGPSINCDQPVSKKIKITDDQALFQGAPLLNVSSTTHTDSSHLLNATLTNFLGSGSDAARSFQASFHNIEESASLLIHNTSSNKDQSQLEAALTKKDTSAKNNRRETKEEQKKSKKGDQVPKKAVTFQTSKKQSSNSNEESSYSQGDSTMDQIMRLTNKKREYLEEAIQDKNGKFCYEEDPKEYKKARKRMQNRESAVRSRLRKKYHQDELEVKIMEMEQIQKQISEQNAGLAAQNALLKKQLAYFEDIFAKSSLLGFDPVSQNTVNKNDLEEFQKNLLNKINQKLYRQPDAIQEDLQPFARETMQVQQLRRTGLDDSDHISSTSISDPLNQNLSSFQNSDERIDSLRLVRSRSNSSNFSNTGYLFLAVVFCMMCCSSLLVTPSSMMKMASQTSGFSKIISGNGASNFAVTNNRKLMTASQTGNSQVKQQQASLASPLNEDVEMTSDTASTSSHNLVKEEPEIGAVSLMKMMLAGQYTYLTYMILSTTCFFFWLTPNCHKIRKLFSFSSKEQLDVMTRKRRVSQYPSNERQVLTRSQATSQQSQR